jgi:hypothetical protein
MNLPKKIATVTSFSILFFVLIVPVGAVIRAIGDPLRLRKNKSGTSYFNFS